MKKWKLTSLVLAAAMAAVLIPINISALDEQAYHLLVNDIYDGIIEKETTFEVNYEGVYLNKTDLSKAVGEAIGTSMENLFAVGGYSYVQNGKSISFELTYSNINAYDITFAPTEQEVVRILNRAISQRKDGVNIYVQSKKDSLELMKNKTQAFYQQVYALAGDDYSKYNLKKINYGVTTVSIVENGCFLNYSFEYNETLEQTKEVDKFVEAELKRLNLSNKTQKEQVISINNAVKDLLTYQLTDNDHDYTAYGAVFNKTAVCQGYALLMDKMMKGAAIDTRVITGKARDPYTGAEGAHMWNAVFLNGQWVHIDTTWNDAYGRENPYLFMSDSVIARDHSFDSEQYTKEKLTMGIEELKKREASKVMLTINSPDMTIGNVAQKIDGQRGTTPILYEDRTLLPLRGILEGLGGRVNWEEKSGAITIAYEGYHMMLWMDKPMANVNGIDMRMEVPPITQNDRTMIPVRFVGEMLGMGVEWMDETQTIVIVPN